jgi:hypothetical protein
VTIDLTPLKNDPVQVAFDPAHEAELLAAFDAPRTLQLGLRPRAGQALWWLGAAAAVIVAAGATLTMRQARGPAELLAAHAVPQFPSALRAPVVPMHPPERHASTPRTSHDAPRTRAVSTFVPWPDADTLPPFESGRLVRVDLPASTAISLGLRPRSLRANTVRADIIVAQDGTPRAMRVAQ